MKSAAILNLLRRVALRARLASLGVRFYQALLVIAVLYALVFVAARLSLIPDYFSPITLVIVPAVALLAALVMHRGPKLPDAARLVDARTDSKDLFLTATMLDGSAGEYQPLVLRDAEAKAAAVSPAQVIAYRWQHRASTALTVSAVLALATVFWTTTLDPFGTGKERKKEDDRRRQLEEDVRKAVLRTEALMKQPLTAEVSPQIQTALEELKTTFNQMSPRDKTANLQRLMDQQKILGQEFQKANEEKLKDSMSNAALQQKLGGQSEKGKEIKDQMEKGDASALKKELEEAKEIAKQMAAEGDPAKKQELKKQLEQKMQNAASAASQMQGSKALADAVNKAMQQMKTADAQGVSKESLDAMQQTLEQAKLEGEAMAQSERDMQALEQALKTIQQAKKANEQKGLDGGECQSCNSMADYEKMFKSMCEGGNMEGEMTWKPGDSESMKPGMGPGGAGPGGGFRPDDPNTKNKFTPDQSKSQLQKGKILMTKKTQGDNEDGEVSPEYRAAVADVKQNLDEAIVREQVPPGYRDGIKKYFDTMGESNAKPAPAPAKAAP